MSRVSKKKSPVPKRSVRSPVSAPKKDRLTWQGLPAETRGLLLLLLSLLSLLALASFRLQHEHANWLGMLGYRLALSMHYLLGFGSYSVVGIGLWAAWRLLHGIPKAFVMTRGIAAITAVLCLCGVLNLVAEYWPDWVHRLAHLTWSHQMILKGRLVMERTALGGEPLYFLLRDLPHANLIRVLSGIGCGIVFGLGLLTSLLVLTDLQVVPTFHLAWQGLIRMGQWCRERIRALRPLERVAPACELVTTGTSLYSPPQTKKPAAPTPRSPEATLAPPAACTPPKIQIAAAEVHPKKAAIQAQRAYNGEFAYYKLPDPSLLRPPKKAEAPHLEKELTRQAQVLEDSLGSFGIEAKVGHIHCGPTIAQFELHPAVGVKVQRIRALESDLALNLEARSIRLLTPIPGKAAVGVEIPSPVPQPVSFSEILAASLRQSRRPEIPMMLGKTVTGEVVIGDLAKMPHCIIAGATGSGKSVCLNAIISSILMTARPDEVRLLMVDPKKVELTHYSPLPHMLAPVITDAQEARSALYWLVKEMEQRYELLRHLQLRNIHSYNSRQVDQEKEEAIAEKLGKELLPRRLPYYVGIIDELADLMMVANADIETPIARIAQMARAVGIHLILATQRPSREVITGLIKANFPTRIAFKVSSRVNSQIILDDVGAENLLGNGDMLYLPPGHAELVRAQGCYVSDEEISRIVQHICEQAPPRYVIEDFADYVPDTPAGSSPGGSTQSSGSEADPLFTQAVRLLVEAGAASTTYLQRKLKIGYARAAALMDQLEEAGVVGPADGARPRKVLRHPDE